MSERHFPLLTDGRTDGRNGAPLFTLRSENGMFVRRPSPSLPPSPVFLFFGKVRKGQIEYSSRHGNHNNQHCRRRLELVFFAAVSLSVYSFTNV